MKLWQGCPLLTLNLFHFKIYYIFCCPIICADLRGTAPMLLIPASLPPATTKTHSASWPNPRGPQEETSDCWWDAWSERGTALLPSLFSGVHYSACSVSTRAGCPLLCPLLTTVLSCRVRLSEHPPPILLCGHSGVEGFDQVREDAGTVRLRSPWEHGMKGHRNEENFILFLLW